MPQDYQDRQIKIQINRVKQIDNLDFDIWPTTNQADFEASISVGTFNEAGGSGALGAYFQPIGGKDDLRPRNWILNQAADGSASTRLPIKIRVKDNDGNGENFNYNDHVDISPNSGKDLLLFYNLVTNQIIDSVTNRVLGNSGQPITLRGNESERGEITFTISQLDDYAYPANQFISQNTPGMPEISEISDAFGQTLAIADFNRDGYDDLAIGAPNESNGTLAHSGMVHVLKGSSGGLTTSANQLWHQDSPGVQDVAQTADIFGGALAAGDFNRDGYADLAIGATLDNSGKGNVNVLHGSVNGLTSANNQLWTQDSPGILGVAETGDYFGTTLLSGDFNQDGYDDLVVGVPYEAFEGATTIDNAGAVNVIYGSARGLNANNNQQLHQDSPNVVDSIETNDFFGSTLAKGDFNRDGYDDLVVGVPSEDVGSGADTGMVNIFYGSGSGLFAKNIGAYYGSQIGQQFGTSLTTGDFNKDGYDDLAIGSPAYNSGSVNDAGRVTLIYGSRNGLGTTFDHLLEGGLQEAGDTFGSSLTAGDLNKDGYADLIVGIPGDNVNSLNDAGSAQIFYGKSSGFNAGVKLHQDYYGIPGKAEAYDKFGKQLGLGDFNNNNALEIAVGNPSESIGGAGNAGAVNIIGQI